MRFPSAAAVILFLASGWFQPAGAGVIDGNLTAGGGYDTMNGHPFGGSYSETDLAVPFTPKGSDFRLETVVVAVSKFASTAENRFAVHVCQDAGGKPGTIMETAVVRATVSWPGSLVSATFAGTTLLIRDTLYWLRLDDSHSPPFFSGGPFSWMYNSTADFRVMMKSTDGGTGWTNVLGGHACSAFRVEGTAVPPPVAPALQCRFEFAGGVPVKLVWQTGSGWSYDLFRSTDLAEWFHVDGFPKPGNDGPMEHPFSAGARGFFRLNVEPASQ